MGLGFGVEFLQHRTIDLFSACPKTFTIAEGSKANAVEEKIIEIGSYVIQQY